LGSSAPATAGATAGQYEGSLASSLQTLIQQLGSGGTAATPATANLTASFNKLEQSVSGTSAASGRSADSSTASNQSLTTFLNNLLLNVQSGGHALSALGGNVNAKV